MSDQDDKIVNDYDAGLGTTPDMWEMLSDILEEEEIKLPESLNKAIVSLRDGNAMVVKKNE